MITCKEKRDGILTVLDENGEEIGAIIRPGTRHWYFDSDVATLLPRQYLLEIAAKLEELENAEPKTPPKLNELVKVTGTREQLKECHATANPGEIGIVTDVFHNAVMIRCNLGSIEFYHRVPFELVEVI